MAVLPGKITEQIKKVPMVETGRFKSGETEKTEDIGTEVEGRQMETAPPQNTGVTRPENRETGRPNR